MQLYLTIALVALVAGRVSAEEVSNVQPVVGHQSQPAIAEQVKPVAAEQPVQPPVQHHAGHGAAHQPAAVVEAVEHQPQQAAAQQAQQHQHLSAPAGLIQVVGAAQPGPQQYAAASAGAVQPAPIAGSAEQYGKPESASLPPNYKGFGSWGLYIGGNPADGYYSSYYKALGNTVDKQQVSGVEQASAAAAVKPVGPMLKQASYPYGSYADQVYPFDYYTQADLNSGSRVAVMEPQGPSIYAAGLSPVQAGSQVYGAPVGYEQPLSYADAYSTKRIGGAAAKGQERVTQQQQQVVEQTPAKGYQAYQGYRYVYAAAVPAVQYQHQYQHQPAQHYAAGVQQAGPQVVAYPVPVGSQIIGSQPGTEGAYAPYGVHGYTRYAVKPTVVSSPSASEQHYRQAVHSATHFPAYKQQVVQPLSFYGYPLNQLHYSSGVAASAGAPTEEVSGQQQQPSQANAQHQAPGASYKPEGAAASPAGAQV